MPRYTEVLEVLEVMAIVTAPVGGNAAARLVELSEEALARHAVYIPAKGGDVYVWFGDENVDAAATTSADAVVIHGSAENVKVPATATHLSVISDADDEFTIPIQVIV